MLQRIHIIGGPGSGKTYAARHLSHLLGISTYDLDDLFWDSAARSYGVRASEADRDAKLMSITDEDTWIIEGVYYRWLRPSFERADIIFVLRPNIFVRDWRILKRFVSRKLQPRQESGRKKGSRFQIQFLVAVDRRAGLCQPRRRAVSICIA